MTIYSSSVDENIQTERRQVKAMTKDETLSTIKKFVEGAQNKRNVSTLALLLNDRGDAEIMERAIMRVEGFIELLMAALPKEQHWQGWLAYYR